MAREKEKKKKQEASTKATEKLEVNKEASLDATMPVHFAFNAVEEKHYRLWQEKDYFTPTDVYAKQNKRNRKTPYVVVIPPPNVTGRLHMGHALNNTIQDMLVRYKRMDGYETLWVPGTDHAGISTQSVVKKMLLAKGIDLKTIDRDDFEKQVWQWKEKYGDIIVRQLKRLGVSCDWSRLRFTMDDNLSKATAFAFKKLYDAGYLYKGKRIVNWCPVDKTALSDDEVEVKEGGENGFLYHILYPFITATTLDAKQSIEKQSIDKQGLVVATTRPETLFGDLAVAVHPQDTRYQHLIGKSVLLPLMNKAINIIADEYVDKDYGTGCVKITPAHDANDFEVGERHQLGFLDVMQDDATMNENVPSAYQNLSREKCRQKVLDDLKHIGLLVKTEPAKIPLGRSYRSKAIIEYRLSEQWFIKMKPLAELALKHHHEFNIHPKNWEKVYLYWLDNIKDWCVSRQIWWGHRIPIWTHNHTGEVVVSGEPQVVPSVVQQNSADWTQEQDVLDTWFSSALWPWSVMGWPNAVAEKNSDFKRYFPTTLLSTAKDILFFWVARMNIMSVFFHGKMPYRDVYFHAIVMDEKGQTMSKSKGNGIDPIHIIEGATNEDLKTPIYDARPSNIAVMVQEVDKNYPDGFAGVGADALRYTLIYLSSSGQELHLSLNNFLELGRRFVTKLWNASRFILLHLDENFSNYFNNRDASLQAVIKSANAEDGWIVHRLAETIDAVRHCMDTYQFSRLGEIYYNFVWRDFCDWYIELKKSELEDSATTKAKALWHLSVVLRDILKLLHPLIPFVTEEIWQKLRAVCVKQKWWQASDEQADLIVASFPSSVAIDKKIAIKYAQQVEWQKIVVNGLRAFKKANGLKDREKISATYLVEKNVNQVELEETLKQYTDKIIALSHLENFFPVKQKPEGCTAIPLDDTISTYLHVFVDMRAFIDPEAEKNRLQKEVKYLQIELERVNHKLANEQFVANAKKEVVNLERSKKNALDAKLKVAQQALHAKQ